MGIGASASQQQQERPRSASRGRTPAKPAAQHTRVVGTSRDATRQRNRGGASAVVRMEVTTGHQAAQSTPIAASGQPAVPSINTAVIARAAALRNGLSPSKTSVAAAAPPPAGSATTDFSLLTPNVRPALHPQEVTVSPDVSALLTGKSEGSILDALVRKHKEKELNNVLSSEPASQQQQAQSTPSPTPGLQHRISPPSYFTELLRGENGLLNVHDSAEEVVAKAGSPPTPRLDPLASLSAALSAVLAAPVSSVVPPAASTANDAPVAVGTVAKASAEQTPVGNVTQSQRKSPPAPPPAKPASALKAAERTEAAITELINSAIASKTQALGTSSTSPDLKGKPDSTGNDTTTEQLNVADAPVPAAVSLISSVRAVATPAPPSRPPLPSAGSVSVQSVAPSLPSSVKDANDDTAGSTGSTGSPAIQQLSPGSVVKGIAKPAAEGSAGGAADASAADAKPAPDAALQQISQKPTMESISVDAHDVSVTVEATKGNVTVTESAERSVVTATATTTVPAAVPEVADAGYAPAFSVATFAGISEQGEHENTKSFCLASTNFG